MSDGVIIDQLKKTQILELLQEGKRVDGRQFDEPRKLSIDIGVIPKAEGSARARLGDTEVVAGVKIQPERPFPDTGDKGMLICTAEILPIAHPSAETGPPQPPVVELARVTDRGIRESGMLDMKQLVLEKDKSVIGIFCDNAVTDHDGNLFDACSYASTAAINSCKIPKYPCLIVVANSRASFNCDSIKISLSSANANAKALSNSDSSFTIETPKLLPD